MPKYAQKLFDERRVSFDKLRQMYTQNRKFSSMRRYNFLILKNDVQRIFLEHVSAVTLHFILRVLQSKYKIDTDALLEEVGINADIFLEENSYVSSDKIKALFQKAAELCQDPCLALHLGTTTSSESLGLLGYMLANSANVEQMLRRLCNFSILIGKNLQFTFILEKEQVKLLFTVDDNPLILIPKHQVEIHLSAIVTLIRQLCGQEIVPKATHFHYAKVSIIKEYEKLFGEHLVFDAYENALIFSKETLSIPLKNAYPGLLKYFESQAEKIIDNFYDTSWNNKVRKLILVRLGNEPIDIETVASLLHVNVRRLQSYLKQEAFIYSKLLEDVRKKLALYYLQNFSIDIGTIALYLGYNDLSSFTRSFKKWYGASPQTYRAKLPYNLGHAAIMTDESTKHFD